MFVFDGWPYDFCQKYPFNIFCAAFIGRGCGIHGVQMWHLRGTDAAQIMLKCRLYHRQEMSLFCKMLVMKELEEGEKTALFPTKIEVVGKEARHLCLFCDKYLTM